MVVNDSRGPLNWWMMERMHVTMVVSVVLLYICSQWKEHALRFAVKGKNDPIQATNIINFGGNLHEKQEKKLHWSHVFSFAKWL